MDEGELPVLPAKPAVHHDINIKVDTLSQSCEKLRPQLLGRAASHFPTSKQSYLTRHAAQLLTQVMGIS